MSIVFTPLVPTEFFHYSRILSQISLPFADISTSIYRKNLKELNQVSISVRNAISIRIIIVVDLVSQLVSYNSKHVNHIQHMLELLMHMGNNRTNRMRHVNHIQHMLKLLMHMGNNRTNRMRPCGPMRLELVSYKYIIVIQYEISMKNKPICQCISASLYLSLLISLFLYGG